MDIEKVALEAIKQKVEEIFKKVVVSVESDNKSLFIRISIPDQVSVASQKFIEPVLQSNKPINGNTQGLDAEATTAMKELLGQDVQDY